MCFAIFDPVMFYSLLEEGKIQESEASKLFIEKLQRDRRKETDDSTHVPLWFV